VSDPQRPSAIGDDLGLGAFVPPDATSDEQGRRHAHPVTPIVHGVAALPFGIAFAFVSLGGVLASIGIGAFLGAVLVVVIIGLLVTGWSYLAWRNLWYWFDDDGDFRVDSGVVTRRQRRLQLSRLQAVDVAQPLFARLFAMAEVTIEVAGTGDSRVRLRYLTLGDARALRSEVLARAAGLGEEAGEAPEAPIVQVPHRDLAVSLLARSVTAGLLLLTVVIFLFTWRIEGWGGLGVMALTGGIPILVVVTEFIRYFGFRVSESPDGLRLRFGLARTETRTVPPGRVQAIEFVEPLLWRRWGWVRVRVNIAGVNRDESGGSRQETLLIPVAPREVAVDLVQRVLPGLDLESLQWHEAPPRARWRAPVQWRRLAVAWDGTILASRRGRITRRLAVMPHARTQSVRVTQGPWERALDLASMHADSTPGPVRVAALHLDAVFARSVADDQAARARLARGTDTSTRWAQSGE